MAHQDMPKGKPSGDYSKGFPKAVEPGGPFRGAFPKKQLAAPSYSKTLTGSGITTRETKAALEGFEYTKRTGGKFYNL